MCGRTACTLDPEDIRRACAFKDQLGQLKVPKWREAPNGRNYFPSCNCPPTNHTPIMFASKHIEKEVNDSECYTIQPMYWGMVPFWHKGSLKEVGLSTNNAKFETILEKSIFNVPLKKGRRCVVIADGYYEWQTSKSGKQPYFIYFPQPPGIQIENQNWKNQKTWHEKEGWLGPRLLTMAGVFNIWNNPQDNSELYSYSIITLEASPAVNMVHERMPAILDGHEAIKNWLDFENVSMESALKLIQPLNNLTMHPVTKEVGNSRNKSTDCNKPIDLKKPDICKSGKLMMNWLAKGSPTKPKVECDKKDPSARERSESPTSNKKLKTENV